MVSIWNQLNSSPLSAAYMRHWIGSALVQIMACRVFGTKSLPEPVLAHCQLDSSEQLSVKSELYHCHSRKYIWNCRLPKWWPFCPRGRRVKWYLDIPYLSVWVRQKTFSVKQCVWRNSFRLFVFFWTVSIYRYNLTSIAINIPRKIIPYWNRALISTSVV